MRILREDLNIQSDALREAFKNEPVNDFDVMAEARAGFSRLGTGSPQLLQEVAQRPIPRSGQQNPPAKPVGWSKRVQDAVAKGRARRAAAAAPAKGKVEEGQGSGERISSKRAAALASGDKAQGYRMRSGDRSNFSRSKRNNARNTKKGKPVRGRIMSHVEQLRASVLDS